ncbi:MAG TPA: FAD-dependent monooxygenase [Geminicoccaceae bacterium]
MGRPAGSDPDSDVIVVGGGHAGLLLALGLDGCGLRVSVIEAMAPEAGPSSGDDGRALALMYGSKQVLDGLGAWAPVQPFTTPVTGVRVRDLSSGASASYDAREVGHHPFAYGILNGRLRGALLQAVRDRAGIELIAPDRLEALSPGGRGLAVQLASGGQRTAALVVGADGRASSVRRLAGIRAGRWRYDQTALTFAVHHERPHDGLVREFLRPAGPLALLPIGPRQCSITWVEGGDVARWLAGARPEALLGRLGEETGGVLGPMRLEGEVRSWPLEGHVAARPVARRVALVGDAAHGTHPIHAQGFNLGVRDVGTLVGLLAEAKQAGRDLGGSGLLLDYARRRRGDTWLTVNLTDGLARLFSNDLAPARLIRGIGLSLIDGLPPLKAMAMRRGMGLGAPT